MMNQIIYKISLDMNAQASATPIYVKCGEAKTRKLIISLYNGTKPYTISDGATAKLRAMKADDTILFKDCTISGNTIQYVMPDTMLSAEGVVRCEVVIYGTDADVLYTPMFQVIVSETLDLDGMIESTSDFSALSTAMTSITTLESNVEAAEAGRVAAEIQRDNFYNQVYTDFGIGFRGTTFTPTVSVEGDISWTNDGNKPNPATVNIKGPQGEPGSVPIVQTTGQDTTKVMSQKAVTDAIDAGGGGGGAGSDFEPIGCMKFFAGGTLPDGYLWCDGASYPANGVYKKLFDIIGETYNQAGDAAGAFRVPDMRGRVGVGKDAGTFDALGKTGGAKTVTLTDHQIPSVGLQVQGSQYYYSGTTGGAGINAGTYGANVSDGAKIMTLGGGKAHNNLQPYLVCNYIIKYDRSYEQIGVAAPPVVWEIGQADWQDRQGGRYVLSIPESEHRRGEHCVLTALYDTTEAGKLKAVLFEMEKNEAGDITIYSDRAFAGKAYIDRVYMAPAGRVLSVNGQGPDMDGDVAVKEERIETLDGIAIKYPGGTLECIKNVSLPLPPATASGGIYVAKIQNIGSWGAAFIETPDHITVEMGSYSGINIPFWLTLHPQEYATREAMGSVVVYRHVTWGSGGSIPLKIRAIGRWK